MNGIAAKSRLDFYPTVLQNATIVTGTNWDGETSSLAQADGNTTLTHALYYPAGDYTVQAYVKGPEGGQVNLVAGTEGDAGETSKVGTDNGWQRIQVRYMMKDDGVLRMTLNSDADTWQVGAISIIKNVATLIGDVNGDGNVNITDVTLLVNHILGNADDTFIIANADINGDGNVSITDVTGLVNVILH